MTCRRTSGHGRNTCLCQETHLIAPRVLYEMDIILVKQVLKGTTDDSIVLIWWPSIIHWWASSSDTLIYPSIFAFPSLSLHRQSTTTHLHSDVTAHDCTRMTIALASLDRSRLFDGHMIYDSHVFTSILSISNVPPPVVQPIMSSHTVRSGTFYNFTLCSLSCFPFIFNLPVFTFHGEHHQRRATQLPIPVSPRIEI